MFGLDLTKNLSFFGVLVYVRVIGYHVLYMGILDSLRSRGLSDEDTVLDKKFLDQAEEQGVETKEKSFVEYKFFKSEYAREDIIERMDLMIENVRNRDVDTIVFLDRSARPLSWMFREGWKLKYPDEDIPDVKFVNIGTSSYFHGGDTSTLQGSDLSLEKFDEVQDLLCDGEQGKWMSKRDIPREWRDKIDEQTGVVEELKRVYKDEFAGGSILVVDELSGSGSTQMTALRLFENAFPDADWHSVNFYKSEARFGDLERDKQKLPWFRRPGLAGVLELPDNELLSSRVNQPNIDTIRDALREKIDSSVERAKQQVGSYLDLLHECEAYIDKIEQEGGPDSYEHLDMWQMFGDGVKEKIKVFEVFQTNPTWERYDRDTDMDAWKKIFDAIYDNRRLRGRLYEDMNGFLERIRDESPYCSSLSAAERIAEVWEGYKDVGEMKADIKQLRGELKRLAKEMVDDPPERF